MNRLNHWNWLKDLEIFLQSRDSLLSHSPTHRSGRQQELTAVSEWSPVIEISENDKEYLIKAELPGLKKEDVRLTAEAGTLTLTGQCKFETEEKAKKHHRVELAYCSFGRTFSLPDDVSPRKVSAELKHGVLLVRLIKGEKAGPGQVEIEVS